METTAQRQRRKGRQGLEMDGDAAPAHEARSQGQIARLRREAAQSSGPAAKLPEAQKQGAALLRREPGEGGEPRAQGREKTVCLQQTREDCEEEHKGADAEDGRDRAPHGFGQRPGKGRRFGRGRGLLLRDSVAASEQQPCQESGQGVGDVEQQARPHRTEDPRADGPHQKGGAGVVAEAQQPLRFPGRDQPLFRKLSQIGRAHGVAAGEADKEGRGPLTGHAEEPPGQGREAAAQKLGKAQPGQQQGDHKERKKRGDDQLPAQTQTVGGAADHFGGGGHQNKEGAERRQDRETAFHVELLFEQLWRKSG